MLTEGSNFGPLGPMHPKPQEVEAPSGDDAAPRTGNLVRVEWVGPTNKQPDREEVGRGAVFAHQGVRDGPEVDVTKDGNHDRRIRMNDAQRCPAPLTYAST